MASYAQIQNKCKKHNLNVRNVKEVGNASSKLFWDQSAGDFFVHGGTDEKRTELLIAKVQSSIKKCNMPTIILNTSKLFENELIRLFRNGQEGKLVVFTDEYKNYQVFQGISSWEIKRYLQEVAVRRYQSGTEGMHRYMEAFLMVLEKCFEPNLSAIAQLLSYSDEKIIHIGQKSGVLDVYLNQIKEEINGGILFREIVNEILLGFNKITTIDCESNYSINSQLDGGRTVFLINVLSSDQWLINYYFSMILQHLKSIKSFRLIMNGLQVQQNDGMVELIRDLTTISNIEVGIVASNVIQVLMDEEICEAFSCRIILSDGKVSRETTERLLKRLGQYEHYEVVLGGGKPAGFFKVWSNDDWKIMINSRDRIRWEEFREFDAVLYGYCGDEVMLVRRIRDGF